MTLPYCKFCQWVGVRSLTVAFSLSLSLFLFLGACLKSSCASTTYRKFSIAHFLAAPAVKICNRASCRCSARCFKHGAIHPILTAFLLVCFDHVADLAPPCSAKWYLQVPPERLKIAAAILRLLLILVAEVQDYFAEAPAQKQGQVQFHVPSSIVKRVV